MKSVLLSVIIPAYNSEKTLEECVLSVENTLQRNNIDNCELIIVDDGSTDNTYQIAEDLSNSYENIRIIKQKNQGVSVARNTGMESAFGEYITFLDSDDFWYGDNISSVIDVLCSKSPDVLLTGHYKANKNGKIFYTKHTKPDIISGGLHFDRRYASLEHINSVILKKTVQQKYDILFPLGMKVGEDVLYTLKTIYFADSVIRLDLPYYVYKFNPVSVSHKKITMRESFELLYRRYIEFIKMGDMTLTKSYGAGEDTLIKNRFYGDAYIDLINLINSSFYRSTDVKQFNQLLEEYGLKEKIQNFNEQNYPDEVKHVLKKYNKHPKVYAVKKRIYYLIGELFQRITKVRAIDFMLILRYKISNYRNK